MITTMNMSGYEFEQDDKAIDKEIEYGDEVMCSGWNPAVDLVCELQIQTEEQVSKAAAPAMLSTPDDVSMAVSEIVLRKMYSYQH